MDYSHELIPKKIKCAGITHELFILPGLLRFVVRKYSIFLKILLVSRVTPAIANITVYYSGMCCKFNANVCRDVVVVPAYLKVP